MEYFKFIKSNKQFNKDYNDKVSATIFRRRFNVDNINNATLKVCALGYGYCYINGKKITNDLFTAPVSNYDKMCWYNTYDISSFLVKGENVIAIICGCGFFNETFPSNWDNNKAQWRDNVKVAIQIENDNKIILESDEKFIFNDNTFVVHNQLRSGEIFDARLYDPNWKELNYDDSNWGKVIIDKNFKPVMKECKCEPIIELEKYKYISCKKTDKGYLLDFGQNMSGYISVYVDGKEGQEIKFSHSEEVFEDGSLKLNGLDVLYPTVDFQVDRYICGKVNYRWSPKFTYHGFRYVLIEGLDKVPSKDEIYAIFVHQDIKRNTTFECSNDLLNKIYRAGIMATWSNMFYSLTDCPTREKFGWTNDAQASAEQVVINFDSKLFFEKWIEDYKHCMLDDGQVPAIVPTHGYGYGHGPVADGCFFEIPYRVYQYTGDSNMLVNCLPYFIKYYNFFASEKCVDTYWLRDWDGYTNHNIDGDFIRYYYTIKLCNIILIAEKLANNCQSKKYIEDIEKAKEYLQKFLNDDGTTIIEGQTAPAIFITIDLGDKQALLKQLKDEIDKNDGHLNCGMFGIQYIYDALSENGEEEYAYKVITAKGAPGFDNWFTQGATTLWETWQDSGFTDSRNHQMFSNVLAWFIKNLLGIRYGSEFENNGIVELRPKFIKELNYCKGSLVSKYGVLEVNWERNNNTVTYKVSVPNGLICYYNNSRLIDGLNIIKEDIE